MKFEFSNNVLKLLYNNKEIGNATLGKQSKNVFRVLRVFVDGKFRGQGLASKIMDELVKNARQNNFLLVPVCSFAVLYFKKNVAMQDVVFKLI